MGERAPGSNWLGGIGDAFADRNFRVYSVGSLVSWITYFVQEIAVSWAAWEATHSPAWLAAVSLLNLGAMIVLVPLGGAWADRHDRFRVQIAAYAVDAAKSLVLAVLAYHNRLSLPVICAAALSHGIIHSFSVPASYGMMPRFVASERLASAIGVSAAYTQFAVFVGPALAGWLLLHGGVAAAFAANVAGYAVYFVSAALLRTPNGYVQPRLPQRSLAKDVVEGVRYVYRHGGLRALLALGLVSDSVSAALYRMAPAYSDLIFHRGVDGVAWIYGAAGLGATASALSIAHGGVARATPRRILWAGLGVAISVLLFAMAPSLAFAIPAMLLFGFSAEARRTGALALMQLSLEDAQRGRVLSTLFLFTQLAGGVGTLALGASAAGLGLRGPTLASAAVLALVFGLVFARRRQLEIAFAGRALLTEARS